MQRLGSTGLCDLARGAFEKDVGIEPSTTTAGPKLCFGSKYTRNPYVAAYPESW